MRTISRKEQKAMTPDLKTAAIKATETLIRFNVTSAPVDPLPILKKMPGVLVMSFEAVSKEVNQDRRCVISMLGEKNQDAYTVAYITDGKPQYLVMYNKMLSANLFQRALARELGHIVLGHDGSKPEDVRNEEAKCFANHLICPRALIHSIEATGMRITTDLLGNITGCYDYCLSCMRKQQPVKVPAELNQLVRDMFMPYVLNLVEFQRYAAKKDISAVADFGCYMEGYEE